MRVSPHQSIFVKGNVALECLGRFVTGAFSHFGLCRTPHYIVCLTQLASVSRCPIEGRLQLVAVQFDGTVAVAFLACPLNEVRIEDIGNLRWHQRTGELLLQLDDTPQNMVVVERWIKCLPIGPISKNDFPNGCI